MAPHETKIYTFVFALLITSVTIPSVATQNIDCNGKAFHCVNSTHFKICVDLGGGVSTTVDDFLIPCPRNTVCKDNNYFECEYQPTTTAPSTEQSGVSNDETSVTATWENFDILPLTTSSDVELSRVISSTLTSELKTQILNNQPVTDLVDTSPVNSANEDNNINSDLSVSENYTNAQSAFFEAVTSVNGLSTAPQQVTLANTVFNSTTLSENLSTTENILLSDKIVTDSVIEITTEIYSSDQIGNNTVSFSKISEQNQNMSEIHLNVFNQISDKSEHTATEFTTKATNSISLLVKISDQNNVTNDNQHTLTTIISGKELMKTDVLTNVDNTTLPFSIDRISGIQNEHVFIQDNSTYANITVQLNNDSINTLNLTNEFLHKNVSDSVLSTSLSEIISIDDNKTIDNPVNITNNSKYKNFNVNKENMPTPEGTEILNNSENQPIIRYNSKYENYPTTENILPESNDVNILIHEVTEMSNISENQPFNSVTELSVTEPVVLLKNDRTFNISNDHLHHGVNETKGVVALSSNSKIIEENVNVQTEFPDKHTSKIEASSVNYEKNTENSTDLFEIYSQLTTTESNQLFISKAPQIITNKIDIFHQTEVSTTAALEENYTETPTNKQTFDINIPVVDAFDSTISYNDNVMLLMNPENDIRTTTTTEDIKDAHKLSSSSILDNAIPTMSLTEAIILRDITYGNTKEVTPSVTTLYNLNSGKINQEFTTTEIPFSDTTSYRGFPIQETLIEATSSYVTLNDPNLLTNLSEDNNIVNTINNSYSNHENYKNISNVTEATIFAKKFTNNSDINKEVNDVASTTLPYLQKSDTTKTNTTPNEFITNVDGIDTIVPFADFSTTLNFDEISNTKPNYQNENIISHYIEGVNGITVTPGVTFDYSNYDSTIATKSENEINVNLTSLDLDNGTSKHNLIENSDFSTTLNFDEISNTKPNYQNENIISHYIEGVNGITVTPGVTFDYSNYDSTIATKSENEINVNLTSLDLDNGTSKHNLIENSENSTIYNKNIKFSTVMQDIENMKSPNINKSYTQKVENDISVGVGNVNQNDIITNKALINETITHKPGNLLEAETTNAPNIDIVTKISTINNNIVTRDILFQKSTAYFVNKLDSENNLQNLKNNTTKYNTVTITEPTLPLLNQSKSLKKINTIINQAFKTSNSNSNFLNQSDILAKDDQKVKEINSNDGNTGSSSDYSQNAQQLSNETKSLLKPINIPYDLKTTTFSNLSMNVKNLALNTKNNVTNTIYNSQDITTESANLSVPAEIDLKITTVEVAISNNSVASLSLPTTISSSLPSNSTKLIHLQETFTESKVILEASLSTLPKPQQSGDALDNVSIRTDTIVNLNNKAESNNLSPKLSENLTIYKYDTTMLQGKIFSETNGINNGKVNLDTKLSSTTPNQIDTKITKSLYTGLSTSLENNNTKAYTTTSVKTNKSISLNFVRSTKSETLPKTQFICPKRGKYSDKNNCNKFYICIGKHDPIVGICPNNSVFSEIRKQCTRNLSHCVRNNQFRCLAAGRFLDVLTNTFYYICVKKNEGYVRFKLQCQKGYHLDSHNVQCIQDLEYSIEDSSKSTSEKSTNETNESTNKDKNKNFVCEGEGKFAHSEDSQKYYVCRKNSKSQYRRKLKKCNSDEIFDKDQRKCVDDDSSE